MQGRRGRVASGGGLVLALVSVAACANGGTAGASGGTPSTTSSTSSTSSATSATQPPTSATPRSSGTPGPSATTSPPTATGGPVPSPGPTRWPKALAAPGQGDPVWAVYLAVAHAAGDAAVQKALRNAAGVGYTAVQGDVACDQGALEALGLDQYDYWSAAALYFATERDAGDFVASYQAKVAGVVGFAQVRLGCLD